MISSQIIRKRSNHLSALDNDSLFFQTKINQSSSESSLLFSAAFLLWSFSLNVSDKSSLYSLFISEASNSNPFSVFFTGRSFKLFVRISFSKSDLFMVALTLTGDNSGRGRSKGGGGGGKKSTLSFNYFYIVWLLSSGDSSIISASSMAKNPVLEKASGFLSASFLVWWIKVSSITILAISLSFKSYFFNPELNKISSH